MHAFDYPKRMPLDDIIDMLLLMSRRHAAIATAAATMLPLPPALTTRRRVLPCFHLTLPPLTLA